MCVLHAGAVEDFSVAIEIEPRYADTWKRRGQARSALGETQEALVDLQKAIDLLPMWGEVRACGGVEWEGRREALMDLQKGLTCCPCGARCVCGGARSGRDAGRR